MRLFGALLLVLLTAPVGAEERLSIDKYVEYFDIVAFGSEIKGVSTSGEIRKWPGDLIKYKMAGLVKPVLSYRPAIERHSKALAKFSGLEFKEIPGDEPGEDLVIWFAAPETMAKAGRVLERDEGVLRQLSRGNCYFLSYHIDGGRMVKAMIVVNSFLPKPIIEHCLLEELTQTLGLPNDSPVISPSIFNDAEQRTELSLIDKVLVRTLYDKRMEAGMTRDKALKAARSIISSLMKRAK